MVAKYTRSLSVLGYRSTFVTLETPLPNPLNPHKGSVSCQSTDIYQASISPYMAYALADVHLNYFELANQRNTLILLVSL